MGSLRSIQRESKTDKGLLADRWVRIFETRWKRHEDYDGRERDGLDIKFRLQDNLVEGSISIDFMYDYGRGFRCHISDGYIHGNLSRHIGDPNDPRALVHVGQIDYKEGEVSLSFPDNFYVPLSDMMKILYRWRKLN